MKFIHLSDVHLSTSLEVDFKINDYIRKTLWSSFEEIMMENRNSDFALIAGDLYEKNNFYKKDYDKLFNIISNFEKPVYYVNGNHDFIDENFRMYFNDKPNNLYLFQSDKLKYYEIENVRIYGLSYFDRNINREIDYDIDLDRNYYNILLLHADVSSNSNYLKVNTKELSKLNFDYVALGHIHKRENFGNNIIYSGSIEPMSFKNSGKFGYYKVENSNIKFINSQKIFFENEIINTEKISEEEFFSNINEKYNENTILRLKLKGKKQNFKIDYNKFNQKYVEVEEDYDEYNYDYLSNRYPNSILSKFINRMEGKNKQALDIGIEAILRSKNE
ncbi:MAG: DNA repair exonuclease [Peptoniphilaceae bacterium]|nr:DNA repair exonuclease [Peptoniphilaceae bacterium]MDD7383007.1 DNA repair exonuclease [Peptoniphilaceae bacterium]MDY3737758.1 DNA repair exonuclease [Peptoniphilaceae bacterium]